MLKMLCPRPKVVSGLDVLFLVTKTRSVKLLCYIKDGKAKLITEQLDQSKPGALPPLGKVNQSHSKVTTEEMVRLGAKAVFQCTKSYLIAELSCDGKERHIQFVKVMILIIPPKEKICVTLTLAGWLVGFGGFFGCCFC